MAEKVGIEIEVKGGQTIGNLKKDLKEANLQLIEAQKNFGDYSKEAIAAAQKVAGLKDSIQEAKETADLFDPGKKFQAFTGVLTSVAGGISAVQGAFGLLGSEGKEVEKSLLKVQSALALSQGLNTIVDSAKDFQRFGAVIKQTTVVQGIYNFVMNGTAKATSLTNIATKAAAVTMNFFKNSVNAVKTASITTATAMRVLRGIMASLGIGALILGVTMLIDKLTSFASSSEKAAEAQKKLAEQNEVVNGALQNQIDVLTAVGNKEKEILALKKQQIDNELNVLRTAAKAKGELTLDELKKFRDLKTQKEVLDIEEQNRLNKIDKEAKEKQDAKNKEQAEKNKAAAQERVAANKQAEEDIRKLRQEAELNAITDENQKKIRQAEIDFENRKLEIESLKASEKLKTQLLVEEQKIRDKAIADAKAAAQQAEFDAIFARLEREQELEEIEKKRIADANQKEFDDLFAQLDAETKAEAAAAEAQKEIEKQKADFRKQQLDEVADALTKLGDIVGKQTAAGKALGIATALINTYQGATEALKQKSTLPSPFDFVAKAINVAAIIASGIKSVKAIAAVKVPGGGGGGTPPIPSTSIGGGAAPISPSAPIQNTLTQLDQRSINQLGSATNRAYVLESDVTNSQERITRINRAARLN
jgi:chemotaxis protein histidine kinase CheA